MLLHRFSHNLGRNNMEQKTPYTPPPKKTNDEVARREKRAIFPSLIWRRGRGGLSVPYQMSKIESRTE